MVIGRERHLDDSSRLMVSLLLQTRTSEMHSVLSDASDEVRQEVGAILVHALDRIEAVLRPEIERRTPPPGAGSFGCGT